MLNKFVAIGLGAIIALAPLAAIAQTEQLAQAAPTAAPDASMAKPAATHGTKGSHRRHLDLLAGRGGRADPRERVLPEQRRCRVRPGGRTAHRPRGARPRNGLPSRTTLASWARPLWQASRRILIGITCSGTPGSARRLVRHGPLCRHCPRSAVGRGLDSPHRRADTAGHRRAGTARPARPHYRPARRDGADPLGWPSSPDCRAPGACPGPCGAAD